MPYATENNYNKVKIYKTNNASNYIWNESTSSVMLFYTIWL